MLVFSGRVKVRISQQRLVFPVEFRDQYKEENEDAVVITVRPDFRSILIYPFSSWQLYQEAMNNGTEEEQDIVSTMEMFAQPKQRFENNGRIKIDPELLDRVGIKGSDAFLLGEGRVVSMWSPETFAEEEQERTGRTSNLKLRSTVFKTWRSITPR
jgi:DNA-binding transcriptional regulator/RsmH inhibitor MraZ